MDFESILFGLSPPPPLLKKNEEFLSDLDIPVIIERIAAEKRDLPVDEFFYMPIDDPSLLEYRYEIFHDILKHPVRGVLNNFSRGFISLERKIRDSKESPHPLQSQALNLSSVLCYIELVESLFKGLERVDIESTGLKHLFAFLKDYCNGNIFLNLKTDALIAQNEMKKVRVRLTIATESVRVSRGDITDHSNYADDIAELFSDFRDNPSDMADVSDEDGGAALTRFYRSSSHSDNETPGSTMDTLEYSIIELVEKIYSPEFFFLRDFQASYPDFLSPIMERLFLELQFYLGYYDFMKTLDTGFCFPKFSGETKSEKVHEGYDLALAVSLERENDQKRHEANWEDMVSGKKDFNNDKEEITGSENFSAEGTEGNIQSSDLVKNDYSLSENEKILFITGPNRSGKTTFLRMIGQLHYLMKLGVPLPAKGAVLSLPDKIFTHFEKSESLVSYNGKLKDDLERIHTILENATGDSLILINEIFVSTTFEDAVDMSKRIFEKIINRGIMTVNIGFLYELSQSYPEVVSYAVVIDKEKPLYRTFKVIRKEAEKEAFAEVLVRAFRLTPEDIKKRIGGEE